MYEIVLVALQVVGLLLLADFASGVWHWAMDTLGTVDAPIWGPNFAFPNTRHHVDPTDILKIHWLHDSALLFTIAVLIASISWFFGVLSWQLVVFLLIGSLSEQIHRFAHAPTVRLPAVVSYLQRLGIFQDGRHHWRHHTTPNTTHYCVITPWVNPVLESIRFWRALERVLVPVFGAPRRPDLQNRPWYRDRAAWN